MGHLGEYRQDGLPWDGCGEVVIADVSDEGCILADINGGEQNFELRKLELTLCNYKTRQAVGRALKQAGEALLYERFPDWHQIISIKDEKNDPLAHFPASRRTGR